MLQVPVGSQSGEVQGVQYHRKSAKVASDVFAPHTVNFTRRSSSAVSVSIVSRKIQRRIDGRFSLDWPVRDLCW